MLPYTQANHQPTNQHQIQVEAPRCRQTLEAGSYVGVTSTQSKRCSINTMKILPVIWIGLVVPMVWAWPQYPPRGDPTMAQNLGKQSSENEVTTTSTLDADHVEPTTNPSVISKSENQEFEPAKNEFKQKLLNTLRSQDSTIMGSLKPGDTTQMPDGSEWSEINTSSPNDIPEMEPLSESVRGVVPRESKSKMSVVPKKGVEMDDDTKVVPKKGVEESSESSVVPKKGVEMDEGSNIVPKKEAIPTLDTPVVPKKGVIDFERENKVVPKKGVEDYDSSLPSSQGPQTGTDPVGLQSNPILQNTPKVEIPSPKTISTDAPDIQKVGAKDPTPSTSLIVGVFFAVILLSVVGFLGFKRLDAIRRRREYRRMNDFLIDGMYNDM
ncbi:hypothetical protein TCAL_01591 [Tigriopus californicus]|uniref:Uncharacterized protein n=1 Tax=Tigriopus californicus TaxID=6832 RepID=A0A553P7G0_TIGCA|nr:uncharacterized protein LOC131878642 [Tigriopus californicus]TRY73570.1 hypothetical protein TCAL_01591 [Tigriopus californicus]|eukprot:TCALIF_01591-PA protein Name:"Protein of unknown function" AED:0.00 eAED:0.00 QI:180/1/1/1/1/1/2/342/380